MSAAPGGDMNLPLEARQVRLPNGLTRTFADVGTSAPRTNLLAGCVDLGVRFSRLTVVGFPCAVGPVFRNAFGGGTDTRSSAVPGGNLSLQVQTDKGVKLGGGGEIGYLLSERGAWELGAGLMLAPYELGSHMVFNDQQLREMSLGETTLKHYYGKLTYWASKNVGFTFTGGAMRDSFRGTQPAIGGGLNFRITGGGRTE